MARDIVTLGAAEIARRRGVPYVIQTHGMIRPSDSLLIRTIDRLLTQRIVRGALCVFVLSDEESEIFRRWLPEDRVRVLPNGTPVTDEVPADVPHRGRVNVLFCSRLHSRKRAGLFAEAAARLIEAGSDAQFEIVGPDEGDGKRVQRWVDQVADTSRLRWDGGVDPETARARIASCDIFVLPSVDEPFGMVVIEAMAASRPVIVTRSCLLSSTVESSGSGSVVEPDDVAALMAAIDDLAGRQFGMTSVGDSLEGVYAEALSSAH
jgi:glycosyltransferase involved in cell wall biosynthesis